MVPFDFRSAVPAIAMLFTWASSSSPTDASALESSISGLERAITVLENSSAFWERWLPWFTAAVVLGVALEVWVIFLDHEEGMSAWREGIVRPPHRPSLRKLVWEVVGSVLVVLGVFGEFAIGVRIAGINGSLRTKSAELRSASDQLLALVTQEAGDAKISAVEAGNAASRSKTESDAALKSAGEAQKKVAQVAQLAEQINEGLGQTQALFSARHLMHADDLTLALKAKFKGKSILLRSYEGDHESEGLCSTFAYVAQHAEMPPTDECGKYPHTVPMQSSIVVAGPNLQDTMDIADLISRVGQVRGEGGIISNVSAPSLMIFVGVKPSFIIGEGQATPAKTMNSKKNAKH